MRQILIIILFVVSISTKAATLEEMVNATKTVEQKYSEAIADITENVLMKYRDSLRIDKPVYEVLSSAGQDVDIKVSYTWDVPMSVLEDIRDTLGKYFITTLSGSKITVGTYNCHGHMGSDFCDVKDELKRFLESKTVGTEVDFLGSKNIFSYNGRGSEYRQSSRYSTVFTVKKEIIKGTPEAKFSTHLYNISGCKPFAPVCNIKGLYRE